MTWSANLYVALIALAATAGVVQPSIAAPESYASWKAANPDQDTKVASLKAKTTALVKGASAGPANSDIDRPPVIWHVPGDASELWDGPYAPEMVVVPAGEYTMGSPDGEPGRRATEGPRHRVRIGYAFAVSKYPITVGQFTEFVKEARYQIESGACYFYNNGHWENSNACSWQTPGFKQGDGNPVVGISWKDSEAYVAWLSKKSGHTYRLLSEAEFEYANRAGTTTAFWWGDDPLQACKHINGADKKALAEPQFPDWKVNACDDGYAYTAPVDAFAPNPFGLYGTTGNSWSFVEDCWVENYAKAPVDGKPYLGGDCFQRTVRGGSWADTPAVLRSSSRNWNHYEVQPVVDGLRIARTL